MATLGENKGPCWVHPLIVSSICRPSSDRCECLAVYWAAPFPGPARHPHPDHAARIPCGCADVDNAFPYGDAFSTCTCGLFIAICVTPALDRLRSKPPVWGEGSVTGGSFGGCVPGGCSTALPPPLAAHDLSLGSFGTDPLGSAQITCSRPGIIFARAKGTAGNKNPKSLPQLRCCRAGWWLSEVGKAGGGGRRWQRQEQRLGPEPSLGFSFNVAKSAADINHCHRLGCNHPDLHRSPGTPQVWRHVRHRLPHPVPAAFSKTLFVFLMSLFFPCRLAVLLPLTLTGAVRPNLRAWHRKWTPLRKKNAAASFPPLKLFFIFSLR